MLCYAISTKGIGAATSAAPGFRELEQLRPLVDEVRPY
jgi:hypothetical protein